MNIFITGFMYLLITSFWQKEYEGISVIRNF